MNRNEQDRPGSPSTGLPRLDRLVQLARAALFWEQLWRAILPPLLIIGFFVAVSFAGLWLEVGALWRMIGVGFFAFAFVVSLVPVFRLGPPSRQEALTRIDRESGVAHRPASTLDDALANPSEDPATQALWRLHRARMARSVEALRAGLPSPRMVDFDRYALRAFVLIALIASAFVAGPEKYARVASAFDWRGVGVADGAGYRVDAWIDPPPYTGKAPVLLKLGAGDSEHPEKVTVPVGSTVIVRSSGGDLGLDITGALQSPKPKESKEPTKTDAAAKPPAPKQEAATDPNEHRLILRGDARLGIKHSGSLLGLFDLIVIPDKPPRIELTDAPRPNLRGSLTLSYKIEDDYGVVSAAAEFSDPKVEGGKGHLRSLVPPPRVGLALPPGPGGLGETEMTLDLSEHPWAGARVKLVLTTTDEAGNEGKSDPIFITLPEKHFVKPLARALAEQRRNLILYPDDKDLVGLALQALMVAPDVFGTSSGVYLGLDVATHMVADAKSDQDIVAAAEFIWQMALQIENGDLSDAERDLRAAEQALREALQRGASDEEIRKLTENLRAAMDKFLSEFAKQQSRQRNAQQMPTSPNGAKSISRKDLQAMLDRMQEMARAGDRASAQQMLEQLQNTLDNLEMAQRQQGDEAGQEMSRALSDLDKLMREQQSLRDKTHQQGQGQQGQQPGDEQGDQMGQGQQGQDQMGQGQQGQGQQGQGQQGQQGQGQQGQGANEALRQQQQALRQRLEELQKRLRQRGQGGEGLDEARRAMQEAERGLSQGGQNGNNAAVDAQGRALQAMRKGADQLAQQMQGQGEGQGEGTPQSQQQGGTDPLGRPMGGDSAFNPNSRYDPMGLPAAQRAQRVLEELRRRLSDPSRAREEMDYLERLLHGY